jgi:hypothetical protein
MAEFKLGRIRFVWKDQWTTGTTYYKDDVVNYGGKTFLCVVGHTAAADFYTNLDNIPTKWNQFSDGQVWKGNWTASSTLYKIGDIVKYGGLVYICIDGHSSQSTLELDQSKWDLFAESLDWKGNWAINTTYKVNDVVKYGGSVYLCNTAHTSAANTTAGLEANSGSWDTYSRGIEWKGNWATSTRYKLGDVIKYGATTYVCNTYHTSNASATSGLEADQSKWDYFNQGIEYKGAWSGTTVRYKVNDVVKNGGGTWICVTSHTSTASFVTDQANWNKFVEGVQYRTSWTSVNSYQPGDIVKYGGNNYISKTAHTGSAGSPPSTNTTDWSLFATGFSLVGDWSNGTAYRVGEIVRNGGYTYVAILDNQSQKPPNVTYWSKLNEGIKWRGAWLTGTAYELGDAIKDGSNSYICILTHTAGTPNKPTTDVAGTYWNLLTGGNEESVLTTTGDLVYYGGAGATRLPVGDAGQVLAVENGLPAWTYFGRIAKVFYVGPNGVNSPAPTYGLTIDQPFASLRYALEQIENGYQNANAGFLLKNNRQFIQKEIVEYIDYQIANSVSPFVGLSYIKATCQRDMGLLVDAIIHDLTHSGNVKVIEAARAYYNTLGTGYITTPFGTQVAQTVNAINYGLTLMGNILANTAPAINYQTLNGIGSGDRIKQYINTSYTAESGTTTLATALTAVVTNALTAGNTNSLPVADTPGYTVFVKTGQFYEVLPMRVPANTAIVGDELRSSRISPAGKIIATNDKAKSVLALQRLQTITDEIIVNTTISPTTGNTATQITTAQIAGSVGSSTAVTSVQNNTAEIKDILTNGIGAANSYVRPDPSGYGSGFSNARRLILANKAFLVDEVSTWILAQIAGSVSPFVGFTYTGTRRTKCERDVGYIVDALVYDLTYGETSGCNLATQIVARSYYSYGVFVEPTVEKAPALAVQNRIKDIIDNIATGNTAGWTKTTALSQDVSGTPGSAPAATFAQARIQEVYDTINTGTTPTTIAPSTAWVASALVTAGAALATAKADIQTHATDYVDVNYPTLKYTKATCARDVGYMVDALMYDLMFGSNFLSIQSGLSYYRGTSSAQVVIANQLAATQAIINFVSKKASLFAASGAAVLADNLWTDVIGYVNTGTRPIVTGSVKPTIELSMLNGAENLRLNAAFLAAEATAYIVNTNKSTVTATTGSTTDTLTGDTTWMVVGDTVRFTGTVFGGVALNTTYYVVNIGGGTTFKISDTLGGAVKDLSTASGSMTVTYYFNQARCQNDVINYVNAIADDLVNTGNYNSVMAARYYRSALTGSKLEDMYYVRNGAGIRNQTLLGLDGSSDGNTTAYQSPLTAVPNEYGTKRPNAGAYVSLDPGWGPSDSRVWIATKSTYVQNVTTFGIGCIGQKIDGSLHAGGNDSIVSNDFTQVLSDGIGAWVTNLGRAELVSVFSYYNYIGYLAENGGKIRATNGNNSYGTFGAVAEYIDISEQEVTGNVTNRLAEAGVANVMTSGDVVYALEYNNAGSEYSSAAYTFSGSGISVAAVGDEFRDGSVFQVRLVDPGDSTGGGGNNYLTSANTAQGGTTTQITLAAADNQASAAYVGMFIYLTAGTGAGQFGYITAYNAASKVASVSKESTGTAGWDHVVPGTAIEAALAVTTTYTITPRLTFTAPPFTTSTSTLPSSQNWTDIAYGDGTGSYTSVAATGGAGTLATFDVTRREGVYTVAVNVPGVLYVAGNTLTILGTSLGGTTPANDLTITVATVASGSNGVATITSSGTAVSQKYVAIAYGTTAAATSTNGTTWVAMTMPAALNWTAIDYGTVAGVGYYVAVASGSTNAYYSTNGTTWSAGSVGAGAWSDIAYGNGSFVAIAQASVSSTTYARTTNGGVTWTASTFAAGSTAIAYGGGKFVTVQGGGSRNSAYSINNGGAWTVVQLPTNNDSSNSNWVDIAYGNGRFVAIADNAAQAAYSLNGIAWTRSVLPNIYEWSSIQYGQGVFYVTSYGSDAVSSPDGVTWTVRDGKYTSVTVTSTSKDTTAATYTARTLPSTSYWTDVIWTGTKFVAIGHDNSAAIVGATSTDGMTWSALTMPSVSAYTASALAFNGTNKYVGLIQDSRNIVYSADGTTWLSTLNAIPTTGGWSDMTYGADKFVGISGSQNRTAYSFDGVTWLNGTISPSSTEYTSIAYGNVGANTYYVVVSGSSGTSQVSAYSADGITWTAGNTMPSADVWSSVAYGGSRFVAVAGNTTGTTTTKAAFSTNGTTWTAATMPGAAAAWNKVIYGGGAFTAFAYGSTRTAYSVNGSTWVEGPTSASTSTWLAAIYGNSRNVALSGAGSNKAESLNFVLDTNYLTMTTPSTVLEVNQRIRFSGTVIGGVRNDTPYWITSVNGTTQFTVSLSKGGSAVVMSTATGSMTGTVSATYQASVLGNPGGTPRWVVLSDGIAGALNISQGATTMARAYVSNNQIAEIWIREPGSGYVSAPTMTITDPNNTGSDAPVAVRIGNGALAQPTFTNRGTGYATATSTVTGNGFSDNYQLGSYVGFTNLTGIPFPGSNVQIAGIDDIWYRLVNVTGVAQNANTGLYSATLQISPPINNAEAPDHLTATTIRRRYSQVRLTGHDFLSIGTGNQTNTNYPGLPLYDAIPANETVDSGGGRVFYTSTDQDGNFRVGGLFNVEQSTGVATLNADAFNIAGLNELSLGSVALGGTGAVIQEFSTDPYFTLNSDAVIPTQRAIKAYITSQIGGGGSQLNVNTLTAGVIYIAGQTISTTTSVQININTKVNFKGGIDGTALALNYFLLNN